MRVLVVTPYYKPDGGPAAPLYTMLCEELVRLGHDVTALTSVPHYPSGRIPEQYWGRRAEKTEENGVQVIRVPLPSIDRTKLPWRMLQALAFQVGAVLAGCTRGYDVLLTHSPALELWVPFFFFSTLRRKPAIYSVHDVYPGVGIRLGIFRHRPVIWMVEALERYCLKRAHRVRVLSSSFVPDLVGLGVPESKLVLIYDWVDIPAGELPPCENSFSVEHNLCDRFVVLFAGNLGFVQGLVSILKAADLLRDNLDIRFLFVGEGGAKSSLLAKTEQLNLPNVQFVPYQRRERMPEIFAASALSLVTLRTGTGFGALPSKTYSILASERPVIASVDEGSDTWDLVERAHAGMCIPPESPRMLADVIIDLYRNPEISERLGKNGRRYVMQYHSPENAARAFEQVLADAAGDKDK